MKYPYRDFLSGLLLLHSIEFVPEFSYHQRLSRPDSRSRKTALMVIIKSRNNYTHHEYHPVLS